MHHTRSDGLQVELQTRIVIKVCRAAKIWLVMLLIPCLPFSYIILNSDLYSDNENKTERFYIIFNHAEFLKLVTQTAKSAEVIIM